MTGFARASGGQGESRLHAVGHFAIEMLCEVARGGTEAATPEQPQSTCGVKLRLQA